MKKRITVSCNWRGFTILELLVAVAVLALTGLLIAQTMDGTARSTRVSNRAVGASAQARVAFDRIGMDLAALVRRPDTDFRAASDSLLFLSGVSSPDVLSVTGLPGGNRGESVVSYKVDVHPDNPDASGAGRICLLRGTVPIGWDEAGFMGMSTGVPVPLVSPSPYLPGDFDILAPGVLRMVVGFQLCADNQPATLADNTQVTAAGQVVYSPPLRDSPSGDVGINKVAPNRISALVIGLVAIDEETLKQLDSFSASALAGYFSTPTGPSVPVTAWTPMANAAATAANLSDVPPLVRQAVRIYQRVYPIAPYGRN